MFSDERLESWKRRRNGVQFQNDPLYTSLIQEIMSKSGTMKTVRCFRWQLTASSQVVFEGSSMQRSSFATRSKSSFHYSSMQKVNPHIVEVDPRGCNG